MAKIQDFIIDNFNGGLVKDKSDLVMNRNEFKNTLNLDFDETGKAKRRRGIQRIGAVDSSTTSSGIIDESTSVSVLSSNALYLYHVYIDRSATATLYRLIGTYTTVAITTATTTITVGSTGAFDAASGNIEIDGDIIAYTGTSATSFTGCTGILKSHSAYSEVHQVRTTSAGATGLDTRCGAYFAVLNNLLFINGRAGSATWNGSSISAVSDADEPAGLFATNYRDRIYLAGSGASDGSGTRNGSPIRVSYSDAGDATSWTLTNYFDVEDDRGDFITGLKELHDVLLIFKLNSLFTYDEVQLQQRSYNVGAYNHKLIQRIGNLIYTFCPSGVWVTNGSTFKKISSPVDKYLDKFSPQYDTAVKRVVLNCFSGQFKNRYYLYIGDITDPDDPNATLSDVVLVYDTEKNSWTVQDGYTDLTHFGSLNSFLEGNAANATANGATAQFGECFFAGDSGGKYYRLFENTFLDNQATRVYRGGDLIPNMISDSNGLPISTILETKFYEVGNPGTLKQFNFLELGIEQGDFNVAYRLDKGDSITDWISLGNFTTKNKKKRLKDNIGYKVSFKLTSNTMDTISTLTHLALRGIETKEQK